MASWGIIAPIWQMPLLLISTSESTAAMLLMFLPLMSSPEHGSGWTQSLAHWWSRPPFSSHSVKQVSENDIVPGITLNCFNL